MGFFAVLDEEKVFAISGILNPETFFASLHKLLPQEDYVLGLASFMPDEQVGTWLKSLSQFPVTGRFNFRFLAKGLIENPEGGAYYLHATAQSLIELIRLAAAVKGPQHLCSHVVAFRKHGALFSFYDAFVGPDLLVSSKIPEAQVAGFSLALGLEYRLVDNPQQPQFWRWHSK